MLLIQHPFAQVTRKDCAYASQDWLEDVICLREDLRAELGEIGLIPLIEEVKCAQEFRVQVLLGRSNLINNVKPVIELFKLIIVGLVQDFAERLRRHALLLSNLDGISDSLLCLGIDFHSIVDCVWLIELRQRYEWKERGEPIPLVSLRAKRKQGQLLNLSHTSLCIHQLLEYHSILLADPHEFVKVLGELSHHQIACLIHEQVRCGKKSLIWIL